MDPEKKAATKSKAPLPTVLLATVFIFFAIAVGASYWIYNTFINEQSQHNLQVISENQVKSFANQLNTAIDRWQEQLKQFSESTVVKKGLSEDPAEQWPMLASKLQNQFKHLYSSEFFALDQASLRDSENNPIRFAELDMINRAQQKQKVFPEASQIGSDFVINIAAEVPAQDPEQPSLGAIFIRLSQNAMVDQLNALELNSGSVEIVQQFGRNTQILAEGGTGSGPLFSEPLGNGFWQINYRPSMQVIDGSRVNPTFPLIGIVLLLVLAIAGGYSLGRVLQQRRDKQQQIKGSTLATASAMGVSASAVNSPVHQQRTIDDVDVSLEDEDLISLDGNAATANVPPIDDDSASIPAQVFRSYDIRGLVGPEINEEFARLLGAAIGTTALQHNQTAILVGRDGRLHSESLCDALVDGLLSTGCHVINAGAVPTPVLYYGIEENSECSSGVMVTASHNPGQYNGFKIVINNTTLADDAIQDLRLLMQRQDFAQGQGEEATIELIPDYIDRIFSDVALAGDMHIVIDAGNGITGGCAPALFEELGCDVTPLFCDIDGNFPNHNPDPTIAENLQALITKVKDCSADLGVAFDGDGDRLCVVTPKGEIIWPDRLLMLFAKDIVSRNPGTDVLFDVKSTRQLNSLVSSYGGRPIMARTGHAHMRAKMQETGAMLGGEYSGHIFIKDRWYGFDDGMYAAARLIEIMSLRDQDIDSIFDSFPALPVTPEIIVPIAEEKKFDLIRKLLDQGDFQSGKITSLDGIRVEFAKGWGLVRASNTSAALTLRFEGETEEVITQLQKLFERELLKIDPTLSLNFA